MDERQRGNPAAVAGQGGFGLLGFSCPAQPDALVFLAMVVKAAGYIVHAEFVLCHTVGTAYSDASSHSLLRVDAVCAMRTKRSWASRLKMDVWHYLQQETCDELPLTKGPVTRTSSVLNGDP